VEIRAYRSADLDSVVQLFTDAVHGLAQAHYDPEQLAAWAPRSPKWDSWRVRLANLHTLVADAGDGLVGFIAYDQNGHIDLLYTSPTRARCGVATALYRRCETGLAGMGVVELTTAASRVARPFFARHGFWVEAEERVTRNDVTLPRYAMRKRLASTRGGSGP
jgi:putative acetyltransferase